MKQSAGAVSPARAVAFDVLLRVRTQQSFAGELLHSDFAEHLSRADHGLATELVMGTLRWRSRLDAEIEPHLSQPIAKLDSEVLTALEVATYQLMFLDRIPARAAINESVELIKRARKRSATGFVNAVLRKVATQVAQSLESSAGINQTDAQIQKIAEAADAAALAHASAHPAWLMRRWVEHYGREDARAIAAAGQQTPETIFFTRNLQGAATARLDDELAAAGIVWEDGMMLGSARRLHAGELTRTNAFREGRIATQDEGSHLVALLLGAGLSKGERILDCCAAPGGKTAVIAERNPDASIFACELHPHRAATLRRLVPASHLRVIAADATYLPLRGEFARILVDAPCSGTGTLSRHPEIKWSLTAADLANLHTRQVRILAAALRVLAPGGRLLYSTCSLEPEENERVLEEVLGERNASAGEMQVLPLRSELLMLEAEGGLRPGVAATLTRGPYLVTLPGIHACDGFFAALLQRAV